MRSRRPVSRADLVSSQPRAMAVMRMWRQEKRFPVLRGSIPGVPPPGYLVRKVSLLNRLGPDLGTPERGGVKCKDPVPGRVRLAYYFKYTA